MSRNFLFADFISNLKNYLNARRSQLTFLHSEQIERVCKILYNEGFISGYDSIYDHRGIKFINLKLKYHDASPVIRELKVISKPSRRVYSKIKDVKPVRNGFGLLIISTSRGIMSHREALKAGVGGEILCSVF